MRPHEQQFDHTTLYNKVVRHKMCCKHAKSCCATNVHTSTIFFINLAQQQHQKWRKYVQITSEAHNIFVRSLCRMNFFWSGPTFDGLRSWSHNLKCCTTHVAPTVHTTTTRFMSHNHVVPSRTTNFLSVWTHLNTIIRLAGRLQCRYCDTNLFLMELFWYGGDSFCCDSKIKMPISLRIGESFKNVHKQKKYWFL